MSTASPSSGSSEDSNRQLTCRAASKPVPGCAARTWVLRCNAFGAKSDPIIRDGQENDGDDGPGFPLRRYEHEAPALDERRRHATSPGHRVGRCANADLQLLAGELA